jgi:hypothetical protein
MNKIANIIDNVTRTVTRDATENVSTVDFYNRTWITLTVTRLIIYNATEKALGDE